ncbi:LuxR family two component transcriptional regulator [Aneurinibacillus soli]|uniref:Transcriptional regulatory protein DegU n=1 Tax=Aneurinibacillus soli TaxID=1500254 RepID=A0A0U5AWF4_9BACL|nr:response regulator transcription factor [Aneurinibacillus soli]PYE61499.1 LuxR family two component transcriptional regulator [Aneurinibacillus soli]BAU26546.1 Transcriptional regulatory protein DegU [Aneurinibacillus soli]
MTDQNISILLVDDHKLFREGVKRILEMEEHFTIVGEASDGEEACEMAANLQADVILMDINMPKMTGVQATQRIKERAPESRIIILSIHDDENYVYKSLRSGAAGYLLKEMDSDALIEAINAVANGESYVHPKVTGKLITEFRRLSTIEHSHEENVLLSDISDLGGSEKESNILALTPREREVLQLMAEGKSNRVIGEELFISEKTVKNHVSSILQKLDVQDRTQAVVMSIKNGWVKLS